MESPENIKKQNSKVDDELQNLNKKVADDKSQKYVHSSEGKTKAHITTDIFMIA